jgi:hypothetical protein
VRRAVCAPRSDKLRAFLLEYPNRRLHAGADRIRSTHDRGERGHRGSRGRAAANGVQLAIRSCGSITDAPTIISVATSIQMITLGLKVLPPSAM